MGYMTEEEFMKYFDSIQDTGKFIEIEDFIKFGNYSSPDTLYGKLSRYLGFFHSREDVLDEDGRIKHFVPDYNYFKEFYEKYKNGEFKPTRNDEGYINLKNTLYLEQPPMFARATGWFTDSYLLFPNGGVAISKYPLHYKSTKAGVSDPDCAYCAVIASGMAKALDVSTSENTFARRKDGQLRILSKNFIRDNEELVTFMEDTKIQRSSDVLVEIDQALMLRNFRAKDIADVKFEFLKQEFFAKLIGLKDQKASNTGILTSVDSNGRHVRLAPMFDYDYSFFIGEGKDLPLLVCDNGEADISSVIKQYKDYPGFLDFVKQSVNLDMNSVYRSIYEDTGIKEFEHPEGNERLKRFTDFVDVNLGKVKQTLRDLEPNERGEK